ncbi:hypothetical protein JQX09_12290 [Sulfitobacter pseudonitzschiae]|uniref:Uncharacterized protein n=1 Tax=Pseudosulfitobacter pseudonitzschiae TaxID=1402135 RepID=A0A9Q2P2D8_9RHOB|nr:hypothetical protein [Pseudosulfitobacter pseudonitzschiae]MBM2293098.1 hypothetical protein [Pseudosulfitobacter pseudonitzschiae]MBM2297614.1 hypothetical protein [Pseudosulfitobacter pseudonitzschiae]MBM2302528.1 hypothetical protein [Pseudosulfitobacter pseudonitzschiae]MBM2312482.1 hypothetical protein [Pseudosulfitobacter pseudonitzschiae]MBM2317224.1 hypothetical protein [Pseudosulfitobacter pseudonitzschiae]
MNDLPGLNGEINFIKTLSKRPDHARFLMAENTGFLTQTAMSLDRRRPHLARRNVTGSRPINARMATITAIRVPDPLNVDEIKRIRATMGLLPEDNNHSLQANGGSSCREKGQSNGS